jgi:hypothetical protein
MEIYLNSNHQHKEIFLEFYYSKAIKANAKQTEKNTSDNIE